MASHHVSIPIEAGEMNWVYFQIHDEGTPHVSIVGVQAPTYDEAVSRLGVIGYNQKQWSICGMNPNPRTLKDTWMRFSIWKEGPDVHPEDNRVTGIALMNLDDGRVFYTSLDFSAYDSMDHDDDDSDEYFHDEDEDE